MSNEYPLLEINLPAIRENALRMTNKMKSLGLSAAGVFKGSGGDIKVAGALLSGGCAQLASSRLPHLKAVKENLPGAVTMLLRIPAPCEFEDAAKYADICLVSEEAALLGLSEKALLFGKKTGVILMVDVGDRREGVTELSELIYLGKLAERLPGVELLGTGTNYCCIGGLVPSKENLAMLSDYTKALEAAIGRKLKIVSGGNSTLLLWIYQGCPLPDNINHIRLGGTLLNPGNFERNRGIALDACRKDTLRLYAQVSEVKKKPASCNAGGKNWRGEVVSAHEGGDTTRAIVNLGCLDTGGFSGLFPVDKNLVPIGDSSDHTVLKVKDGAEPPKPGDIICFELGYSAALYSFEGRYVKKRYIE